MSDPILDLKIPSTRIAMEIEGNPKNSPMIQN